MNKAPQQPVILRHPHRTWLTPKGEVVTPPAVTKENEPVTRIGVSFTAKVIDTGTDEDISVYPTLKSNLETGSLKGIQHDIEQVYYDHLRWQDGIKPDIETLKRNVNAGIWAIDVKMNEPNLEPAVSH